MDFSMFLRILTTPNCWVRNSKTSNDVDTFFKALVLYKEHVSIEEFDGYTMVVRFGNAYYRFWVENYPYACLKDLEQVEKKGFTSGTTYFTSVSKCRSKYLPSRATTFEFFDAFKAFMENENGNPDFIRDFCRTLKHDPKHLLEQSEFVDKSKLN